MIKNLIILLCLCCFSKIRSQEVFIKKGIIEYECKINVHKEIEGTLLQAFNATIEKYNVSTYRLQFGYKNSVFTKLPATGKHNQLLLDAFNQYDIYLTDLSTNMTQRGSGIFGDPLTWEDSLPKCIWRITDETRRIVGLDCYRAETIIYDSIYVIAYFSPQIHFTGGPFRFSGLPGTILGMVIPRLNQTIFANRIILEDEKLEVQKLRSIDLQGKRITNIEFNKTIRNGLSSRTDALKNAYLRALL